ncbi:MAG: efflux RND transporter periplasmic adaptor subunit [Gammaproteobacteria bacterium]|nr:efflux RND transporter periplasmic adaptor subunit [Gammaproteobacteria bacterium]
MSRVTQSKFFLPLTVIFVGALIIVALQAGKPEVEEEKNEFPPLAVDVVRASLDEIDRSSIFQGEVRAKTNIELITQVTGKVVSVSDKFIEGGLFEAHEALLKIDDADYLVALHAAQAAVAEARVQLDIEVAAAATNAREWQELQGRSIDEANPLRLNKPQVDRARARLRAAQAELDLAKLNLARTTISAPFRGRIMSKGAELGQFVARGSSMGKVFAVDAMEVRIPMTDTQIADLGLYIGQTLPREAAPAAVISTSFGATRHFWPGHLRSIDASIDQNTRLLYATVVADSMQSTAAPQKMPLAPGLFVDVELQSKQPVAGIKVPRTALRNGDRVYVLNQGKLAFRQVQTVFTSPEIALLAADTPQGVNAGELVVISPVPGAYEGMSVKIKPDAVAEVELSESEPAANDAATVQTAEETDNEQI